MALAPLAWPPANGDVSQIRFVIDVSESETRDLLVELFEKHITVHSFNSLDEVDCDRVIEGARKQATIIITDDACRPMNAVATASQNQANTVCRRLMLFPFSKLLQPVTRRETACDGNFVTLPPFLSSCTTVSPIALHLFSAQVKAKLFQLVFKNRVSKVLAAQKKFVPLNADRYMSKWANNCLTVISASGAILFLLSLLFVSLSFVMIQTRRGPPRILIIFLSLSICTLVYAAISNRSAVLNFLCPTDDAAAAPSLSAASFASPAAAVSASASSASAFDPNPQFRGLGRQAKAAAALTQSFAAAAASTSTSAANGGGASAGGGGGLMSTLSGSTRSISNLESRASSALAARAVLSQSSTAVSLLPSNAPGAGLGAHHGNNPLIHSSAVAAGSIASASASAASASRSAVSATSSSSSSSSSSSTSFSSSIPGLLPPPPGFKRFALTDSRGKYLPLIKDYATDPKRGPLAPVLDLNAPPYCCPFNVYTKNDHERERQKEKRRREVRKAAAAAEAAEAAEEAARAAKAAEMEDEEPGWAAQSSSSSSSSSSSAAMAANDSQPATRERSVQVRCVLSILGFSDV